MRLQFVLLLLFSCVGCGTSMEDSAVAEQSGEDTTAAEQSGKSLEWRWSKGKASLTYSTKLHLNDYEVERVPPDRFYATINVRTKPDLAIIYTSKDASERTVFTRWKDILYIAEYSPIASGCRVAAVDLKSGQQLWRTRLRGIGPTGHSKYLNLVNIETDGQLIVVAGNEAHGRYIEHL